MDQNAIFGLTEQDYLEQEPVPQYYTRENWGDQRPRQHIEVVNNQGEIIDCPNVNTVNFATSKDDLVNYEIACRTQLNNRNDIRLDMLRRRRPRVVVSISNEIPREVWEIFTDRRYENAYGWYVIDVPEGDQGDKLHWVNGFNSAISKYTRILNLLKNPWRIFMFSYDSNELLYVGKFPTVAEAAKWIYNRSDGRFQIREFNDLKYNVLIQGDNVEVKPVGDQVDIKNLFIL